MHHPMVEAAVSDGRTEAGSDLPLGMDLGPGGPSGGSHGLVDSTGLGDIVIADIAIKGGGSSRPSESASLGGATSSDGYSS